MIHANTSLNEHWIKHCAFVHRVHQLLTAHVFVCLLTPESLEQDETPAVKQTGLMDLLTTFYHVHPSTNTGAHAYSIQRTALHCTALHCTLHNICVFAAYARFDLFQCHCRRGLIQGLFWQPIALFAIYGTSITLDSSFRVTALVACICCRIVPMAAVSFAVFPKVTPKRPAAQHQHQQQVTGQNRKY